MSFPEAVPPTMPADCCSGQEFDGGSHWGLPVQGLNRYQGTFKGQVEVAEPEHPARNGLGYSHHKPIHLSRK